MRTDTKLLGALALTAGLIATAPAFAAPVACTGAADNTGLQAWSYFTGLSADGCFQQDKAYSNFHIVSGTAPVNLTGQIFFQNLGNLDFHNVNWTSATNSLTTTFTIGYTIAIYSPVNPATYINMVSISLEPLNGSPTVSMHVTGVGGPYDATAPTDGNPVDRNTIGQPTTLNVEHLITADGTNAVKSTTIKFTEDIPEPATLTLLAVGLAGLGARIRRRKA